MTTEPPAATTCPALESEFAVTIQELYEQSIKQLPAPERFQLAVLILNDIPPQALVDYSDEWSEEDLRDLTLHSLRQAAESMGEDDDA
jgi:hypothetical protein